MIHSAEMLESLQLPERAKIPKSWSKENEGDNLKMQSKTKLFPYPISHDILNQQYGKRPLMDTNVLLRDLGSNKQEQKSPSKPLLCLAPFDLRLDSSLSTDSYN